MPLYILFVLGGLGPTIGAFIVKKFFCDTDEFKQFLTQTIKVKVHWFWCLFIVFVPLLLTFTPWFIIYIVTGEQSLTIEQPLYMIFVIIPTMIVGDGLEEFGWRGFLLPELLKKHSILLSTIIVAIFWTFGMYRFGLFKVHLNMVLILSDLLYLFLSSISYSQLFIFEQEVY